MLIDEATLLVNYQRVASIDNWLPATKWDIQPASGALLRVIYKYWPCTPNIKLYAFLAYTLHFAKLTPWHNNFMTVFTLMNKSFRTAITKQEWTSGWDDDHI